MADSGLMGDLGGAASGASMGAMVGGPVGAAVGGLLGLGLSIFGGVGQSKVAKQQAAVQQDMIAREQDLEAQRKQAMELQAKRQSMEVLRNQQRARSMALNSSTNQGAQFGSGLQGGYGQISGQSGVNLLGINQNLQIGENMFDINAKLSQDKMQMASLGGSMASYSAISSLGGSVSSASRNLSPLIGNMFGSSSSSSTPSTGGMGLQLNGTGSLY